MINRQQSAYVLVVTILAIIASAVLSSCTMPYDGMPSDITHQAINVVSTDGSARWTISDPASIPVVTDSAIIFTKGKGLLFKVKYDGSSLTQLYPGILWEDIVLSPNGKKVLLGTASAFSKELYLMDANGTNLVKLGLTKGWYAWIHVSPDLDEIVFYRDGGIATMNTDGTNFQYIWRKADSTYGTFALYIDETHILYEVTNSSSFTDSLRLFDKTSREDKFVGINSSEYFPIFGRVVNGQNVLISGVGGIKIFNVYTATFRTIGLGFEATYSSDRTQIVASQDKTITTMNSDGSNVQQIYADPTVSIRYPQFSPDGKYVVFETLWSARN